MSEYICMVDDHGDLVPTMEEGYGLIRCNDCKWYRPWDEQRGGCVGIADGGGVLKNGYCYEAVRKEE